MALIRIEPRKERYSEDEIRRALTQPDPLYIELLFAMLLKRSADAPSVAHYRTFAGGHPGGRLSVMFDLYNSVEARVAGVRIEHLLDLALECERLRRAPRINLSLSEVIAGDDPVRTILRRFRRQPPSEADVRWARNLAALSANGLAALAYESAYDSSRGHEIAIYDVAAVRPHLGDEDVPKLLAYRRQVAYRNMPSRMHYDLADLQQICDGHGEDCAFLIEAFETLLKRPPDTLGFMDYLEAMRSGRRSRMDVARELGRSDEARDQGVAILEN